MIQEQHVSFETAKLLKEKGFQNICRSYWRSNNEFDFEHPKGFVSIEEVYLLRPTQQMAMRWLREKYHLYIEICTDKAHNFKDIVFRPAVYNSNLNCVYEADNFKTYEDAVEAAIKECLENLIEHRFIV